MGKGLGKSSSNKIIYWDEQEVALGKQNKRAACPKDKLEFTFFQTLLPHPALANRSSSGYSPIWYLGMCPVGKTNSPILQATSINKEHCLFLKILSSDCKVRNVML